MPILLGQGLTTKVVTIGKMKRQKFHSDNMLCECSDWFLDFVQDTDHSYGNSQEPYMYNFAAVVLSSLTSETNSDGAECI